MSRIAHHLAHRAAWEAADAGAPWMPPSLATEGFVHLSFAAQVDATVDRHFAPDADLVVVSVDLDRLACDVVVEDTTGRGEAHPHAYGPLNRDAVVAVTPYARWATP